MFRLLRRRWRALFCKPELERDLDDELRFHLEQEIALHRARGLGEDEARRAALRSFGGMEQVKESARDARGVRLLEDLAQDVRYGLRMMRKAPGFTAVALLSLALGIGANATLFSVVDAVLLATLPVKQPERLVVFEWEAGSAFRNSGTSGYSFRPAPGRRGSSSFHPQIFTLLRGQKSELCRLAALAYLPNANVVIDGQAEVADGQFVSGNYFSVVGAPAVLGRPLGDDDDVSSTAPAAMLTHRFWQERFGGDPNVVGRKMVVNNVPFTIVGVGPPGFAGSLQVDSRPGFFVPIAFEVAVLGERSMTRRRDRPGSSWWLHLTGRLAPAATAEQARLSLDGAFQSLALELMPPPQRENQNATIEPRDYPHLLVRSGAGGMTEARRQYSSAIYLLFGVVALVLLIACANIANMLLARAAARRSEITVRLAMGAGRLRLLRQLLTESLLLSILGGTLGVALAWWGTDLVAALAPGSGVLPARVSYTLSGRVVVFAVGVSLATGVLFGLAPALHTTALDLSAALRSRTSLGISRSRLSKALVVAQVAVSLVLLLGAGLFVRTVRNLERVEVGFNQQNLLVFSVRPGTLGYGEERLEQLYLQIFARLDALPGVRSATFASIPLLSNVLSSLRVILPGETVRSAADHSAGFQIIRENYFETMQIPLRRGRTFTAADSASVPKVAIVSELLARRYFPGQDPIGQRIGVEKQSNVEIVGVAADTKYDSQRSDTSPLVYMSWRQQRQIDRMSFAVRSAAEPTALTSAVREAIRDVEPALPLTGVTTQVAQSRLTFAGERFRAELLGFFGALAALLAAVGLYGVMAYSVAQRTNEIGIRMALGARRGSVLKLVTWQGLRLVLLGVALGGLAALALERIVRSQLFGVRAADPLTFALVGAALLAVAFLASWIPARRATLVDPAIALRSE